MVLLLVGRQVYNVVVLSTIEVEYMATIEVVKEALWVRGFAEELRVRNQIIIVHCDSSY